MENKRVWVQMVPVCYRKEAGAFWGGGNKRNSVKKTLTSGWDFIIMGLL